MRKTNTHKLGLVLGTALLVTTSTMAMAATVEKDQLFLKNGDRLSGTISTYTTDTVTIDTAYGTFNVPTAKIGGVSSPTYDIADFKKTADVTPSTAIPADATARETSMFTLPELSDIGRTTDVATIEPAAGLKNPDAETGLWGAKWSGNANIGGKLEDGNSNSKSIMIDAETKANWDDIHRMTLGAKYEWEEEEGIKTTDEREANAAYDYFFADKWFWNNSAKWEQDKIVSLDRRIQVTSGLGYQFYDEDDLSLEVTFGPGYQNEKYEGEKSDNSMTANWALDYEQAFYDDLFRLYHNHDLTAPTDDFSAWLFESDTGLKIPLKMGIVASTGIEFDWNNAPAPGEEEGDTKYTVKLGYEW